MCNLVIRSLVCLFLLGGELDVLGEVTQSEDGSEGVISFQPPTLNDEDAHSMHMPLHLKCDSCTAVAYQLTQGFQKMHNKRKSVKKLPESDVYKIVEDVCGGEELTKYGVKEVKKVKRLSGPGLEAEESPGIMQGGGKWPDRMQRMCNLYVEEFDEETIYEEYLKQVPGSLKKFLCENDAHRGLTDVCSKPAGKEDKRGMKSKKNKTLKKKKDEL